MSLKQQSDSHLPSRLAQVGQAAKKILLPGQVDDIRKKIMLPGESKILLSPMARQDAERRAQQPDELEIARPFNHQQRRGAIRFSLKLRRRSIRASMRKEARLQQALYDATANSQRYEPGKGAVRRDSKGKIYPTVTRPPVLEIRPHNAYYLGISRYIGDPLTLKFEGEPLRKSKRQVELESNLRLGVFPTVEIVKQKRLKGSWQPPKPKAKETAAA